MKYAVKLAIVDPFCKKDDFQSGGFVFESNASTVPEIRAEASKEFDKYNSEYGYMQEIHLIKIHRVPDDTPIGNIDHSRKDAAARWAFNWSYEELQEWWTSRSL